MHDIINMKANINVSGCLWEVGIGVGMEDMGQETAVLHYKPCKTTGH